VRPVEHSQLARKVTHTTTITMADQKKRDDYAMEMGDIEKQNKERLDAPPPPPTPSRSASSTSSLANHPSLPILSYCASSILMTVTNKYVLSGLDFNLNFLLLCVQVCGGLGGSSYRQN
jgi:GDP-mannose transporter